MTSSLLREAVKKNKCFIGLKNSALQIQSTNLPTIQSLNQRWSVYSENYHRFLHVSSDIYLPAFAVLPQLLTLSDIFDSGAGYTFFAQQFFVLTGIM